MAGPRFPKRLLSFVAIFSLALPLYFSATAFSQAKPLWWADAKTQADHDGYALLDETGMKAKLDKTGGALLLDARPGYEFEEGHIPGAISLEFDLADQILLDPEKRQAFLDLAGPDKERTIIIYCRSFR